MKASSASESSSDAPPPPKLLPPPPPKLPPPPPKLLPPQLVPPQLPPPPPPQLPPPPPPEKVPPVIGARRVSNDMQSRRMSWENRTSTTSEVAMFSMSVRVQNPPEFRFKRSSSNSMTAAPKVDPTNKQGLPDVPRPGANAHGEPARMPWQATNPALPPQQLLAKLSPRPWKPKEEKERSAFRVDEEVATEQVPDLTLERVADPTIDQPPDEQLDHTMDQKIDNKPAEQPEEKSGSGSNASPEVVLRTRPPLPQTSELLKVFARRSLVPRVGDGHDVAMETLILPDFFPAPKVDAISIQNNLITVNLIE